MAAPLAAEGVFCDPILSVPVTITAQGRYCLQGPLRYDDAGGIAIFVQSDFVTIDLNGYTLDGSAVGPATTATGIYGLNRRNVVVTGGRLRGFMFGIRLDDDATTGWTIGGGHQVEDVQVDACTVRALSVQGRGNRIRGSLITRSGGSTFFPDVSAAAVDVRGPGARIMANTIVETTGVGTGTAWGVSVNGRDATLDGNFITNEAVGSALSIGILITAGSSATVTADRVANFTRGVVFAVGAQGFARANATVGCTTPYILNGARDGGGNN
jgi:hypothetical protein